MLKKILYFKIAAQKACVALLAGFLLLLTACETTKPNKALQSSENSLQEKMMQTRKYDTLDEKRILLAAVQTLQDLGFSIDETESKLGIVVASKNADAKDKQQYAVAFGLSLLDAMAAGSGNGTYHHQTDHFKNLDSEQKIRASLVVIPSKSSKNSLVRITFQRMIWNHAGQLSKQETINDQALYARFFQSLSKAIFLEGHEL